MNAATVFPELAGAFGAMLGELESSPLVVILAPAPSPRHVGHMVRRASSVPPPWYRALCASYPSSRGVRRGKFDTRIRRREILAALSRMADGRPSRSLYAPDLARVALRRLRAQPLRRAA